MLRNVQKAAKLELHGSFEAKPMCVSSGRSSPEGEEGG